ncbi:MAG: hypothetical protein HOE69_00090 [Euryarchaeota archaeon]|jgi:hypothetical protein|nr:hypothetical protein [Euryarchaeota archaeon]
MVQTRIIKFDMDEDECLTEDTQEVLRKMSDNVHLFIDRNIQEWLEYENALRTSIQQDNDFIVIKSNIGNNPYVGIINDDFEKKQRYISTTIEAGNKLSRIEQEYRNTKIDLIIIDNECITKFFPDNGQWDNISRQLKQMMMKHLDSTIHFIAFENDAQLIGDINQINLDLVRGLFDEDDGILRVRSVHFFSPPRQLDYRNIMLESSFSSCMTNVELDFLPQSIITNHIMVPDIDENTFGLFFSNIIKQLLSIKHSRLVDEPLLRAIMYDSSRTMRHEYLAIDGQIAMKYKELDQQPPQEGIVPQENCDNKLLDTWGPPLDANIISDIVKNLDSIDCKRIYCNPKFSSLDNEPIRNFWEGEKKRRGRFLRFLCHLDKWERIPSYAEGHGGYRNNGDDPIRVWDLWNNDVLLQILKQNIMELKNNQNLDLSTHHREWMSNNPLIWLEILEFYIESNDSFGQIYNLACSFAHNGDENPSLRRFEQITNFRVNIITLNSLNKEIHVFLGKLLSTLGPFDKNKEIYKLYAIDKVGELNHGGDNDE